MLRCPFCETDLNDVPLQAGRCPTCGGVMAWQDDEGETPGATGSEVGWAVPTQGNHAGTLAGGHSPPYPLKAAAETSDDSIPAARDAAGRIAASATSQTQEIREPVPAPATAGREAGEPPQGRHSTIRLNDAGTLDASVPAHPSKAGTLDDDEIQKTVAPRPIKPRALSVEQTRTLKKLWSNTIFPGTRPNTTLKTVESLPVKPVSRRVPTRVVQDERETASEAADFRLLEIIGEGGVGIVYAAQQTSVDRTVALKMLRSEISQDWEQRQKFLSEAVVTGDLDHPNIVPIYELGSGHDGALFYAMKRVSGTPWSDVLLHKSQEENLEILMKVADAIAFAHSRGVVHRDLKPENVMLGGFGEVQVMDWGIALPTPRFQRAADILTTGSLGGTPAYMAPEMATGPIGRIGPHSDVYLLGGILYEIITGQTPHSGDDVMACLHAAAANEIQPTHLSGELLNIALLAMATDPADRYESVQQFQAAIREYQSHTESIALSARAEDDLRQAEQSRDYQDYSRALFAFQESYALWAGNHRAVMGISAAKLAYAQCALDKGDFDLGLSLLDEAEPTHQRARVKLVAAQRERDARQQRLKTMKRTAGLLVVVLFVVVGSGLVIVRSWQKEAEFEKDRAEEQALLARQEQKRADSEKREAEKQKGIAEGKEKIARAAETTAKNQTAIARRERALAERQRKLALAAKSREEIARLKTEYETYIARIALAAEKIDGNAFDDARRLLEAYRNDDLRHWEWARLWYLCDPRSTARFPCTAPVDGVAFSPDGREFATAGQDGTVRIWNTSLAGKSGEEPVPRLTFPPVARVPLADKLPVPRVPIRAVAWGQATINGQQQSLIATAGERGSVRLWNAKDGSLWKSLAGHSGTETVTSAVFSISAQHQWLVTGSTDHTAIVWDLTGRQRPIPLRGHSWWVWDVAVSRDQKQIATAGQDGKIFLWNVDARDGTPRMTVDKELADYHNGPVYSVAFSPDGARMVSGGFDNRALVWKLSEAKAVDLDGRLRGQPEPKPNWLVLRGHTGAVRSVQFSPDNGGRLILTCGDDNTVSIWNSDDGSLERTLRGHGSFVRSCRFAPDAPGVRSGRLPAVNRLKPAATSLSDDRLVLSGSHDKTARLWQIAGYSEVRVFRGRLLRGHDDEVLAAVYGPDGRFIATAGKDRTIRVWDVRTQRIIMPGNPRAKYDEGHEYLASSAIFFRKGPHAGKRFVSSAMDGTVRIWQLDSGTEILTLRGAGSSGAIALSHDEGELAAGGRARKREAGGTDYPILIWPVADLDRNKAVPQRLAGHSAEVTALAYSPDGRILVSGDAAGTCYVWERTADGWSKPQVISRRTNGRRHSKRITAIAFLDARRVATASNDNTVSLWNVRTGDELAMVPHPDSVIAMAVSPDGSRIVSTCRAGSPVDTADRKGAESLLRTIGPDGRVLQQTAVPGATVSSVSFAPDGGRVLAMADQGQIWEWTPGRSPRRRGTASDDMWAAAYSPDGKRLLTVGGRRAVLWDARQPGSTLRRLMTFGPHATVSHLSFSPSGLRLASADAGGTVKIWDLKQHRAEQNLSGISEGAVIAALFSPRDDGLLFTVGETQVRRWRFDPAAKSWKDDLSFDIPDRALGSAATAAAMAPDGTWLVIGLSDGTARVLDADGRTLAALNRTGGHSAEIRSVAVSADGQWIVTGSVDKSAIVWERSPGESVWDPIATLSGHPAPVNAVGISRDRFRVLTGSEDKTAKIWDTRPLVQGAVAAISEERVLFRQQVLDDLKTVQKSMRSSAFAGRLKADKVWNRRLLARFEQLRTLTKSVSGPDALKDVNPQGARLVDQLIALLSSDRAADAALDDAAAAHPSGAAAVPLDPTDQWEWKQLRSTSNLLKRLSAGPESITEIFTLRGHQQGVTAVTFSPGGESVLTGSRDGSAVVWPADNIVRKAPNPKSQ